MAVCHSEICLTATSEYLVIIAIFFHDKLSTTSVTVAVLCCLFSHSDDSEISVSSSSALAPVPTGSLFFCVCFFRLVVLNTCSGRDALLVAPAVARRQLNIRLKPSALFLKVVIFLTLLNLSSVWNTTFFFNQDKRSLRKGSCWRLHDLSHSRSHSAESWCHCLFIYCIRSTYTYIPISVKNQGCVWLKPPLYRCGEFAAVPWVYKCLQIVRFVSNFSVLVPHFWAVICHRVQYLCVWVCVCVSAAYTVHLSLSVCILYKPGGGDIRGVCVVWEMEGEGFISEDVSVPCLQPRTFFLMIWSVFAVFHVLSAFYDIKCLCQGRQD